MVAEPDTKHTRRHHGNPTIQRRDRVAVAGLLAAGAIGASAQDASGDPAASGGPAPIAITRGIAYPITVDGDVADWAAVEATTVNLEQIRLADLDPEQAAEIEFGAVAPIDVSLKVASDAENIYMLVEVPTAFVYDAEDHNLSPSLAVQFLVDEAAGTHMGAEEADLYASTGHGRHRGTGSSTARRARPPVARAITGGDDPACNLDDEYATTPEKREDDGGGDTPNAAAENSLTGVWTHTGDRRRSRCRGHLDLRDVPTAADRRPAGCPVRERRHGQGRTGLVRPHRGCRGLERRRAPEQQLQRLDRGDPAVRRVHMARSPHGPLPSWFQRLSLVPGSSVRADLPRPVEAVGVQDEQDVQSAHGVAEPDPSSDAGSADSMLTGGLARRRFVLRALAGIGALIAAMVGIPVAGFAAMPFFRAKTPPQLLPEMVPPTLRSEAWASAGALDDFDVGEPQLVPLQRQVTDGWVTGDGDRGRLRRAPDGDRRRRLRHPLHRTWAARCRSAAAPGSFVCPCHGGSFDIEGQVTGGPPPGPMNRYEVRVVDGIVEVGPLAEGGLTMRRIGAWLDERLGIYALGRAFLDRKIPGNIGWWHTFGSATLVLLLVQIATGIALTMSYVPSPDQAYESILYIDATPFGGLVRGIHHWAAGLLVLLDRAAHPARLHLGRLPVPARAGLGRRGAAVLRGPGLRLHRVPAALGPEGVLGDRGGHQHRGLRAHRRRSGAWSCSAAAAAGRGHADALLRHPHLGAARDPGRCCVAFHLFGVIRQGIAASPRRTPLTERQPGETRRDAYEREYAAEKADRQAVLGGAVQGRHRGARSWSSLVVVVALVLGAPLEEPANPNATNYAPRPEWYFLDLFQLLWYFGGSLEPLIIFGLFTPGRAHLHGGAVPGPRPRPPSAPATCGDGPRRDRGHRRPER